MSSTTAEANAKEVNVYADGIVLVENLTLLGRVQYFCKYHWAGLIASVTPIILMPLLYREPRMEYRCAYALCLMSIYWITEALPLYVTSLLPIVIFPLLGILDSEIVCEAYFSNTLIVFFGSLIVALAIEFCNLHKRVALFVILHVGCSLRKLQFSLLLVTMFFSMWLSNSAATTMMCPIVQAILNELSNEKMLTLVDSTAHHDEFPRPSNFVLSYYLGIAFASSIGGCATLIGMDTNIGFKGIYDRRFPMAPNINFLNFMLFIMPAMIVCLMLVYIWLQWLHFGLFRRHSEAAKELKISEEHEVVARKVLNKRAIELGPISCHELQVAGLFLLMIVAFVTRSLGWCNGWADLIPENKIAKNSSAVILIVLLLFILPVNYNFIGHLIKPSEALAQLHETPSLLHWNFVQTHNHWGLLLLTGGSMALAEGISASGLAIMVGNSFVPLAALPAPLVQLICICTGTIFTTLTSNIAMGSMIMPILMEIALSIRVHPLYLTLPTCLALSMSFLLPISTPPNAIVAAWAHIRSKDMFIAGIVPSLIGIIAIFITSQSLAYWIFPGYDSFPLWAEMAIRKP